MKPTDWSKQEAAALVRFVSSLPPAPTTKPVLPDIFKRRCYCGLERNPTEFAQRKSDAGVFFRENVCKTCPSRKSQWDRLAIIVCVKCREEILRQVPYTDKTGFSFEAGKVYHVLECPACNKALDKSPIVEQTIWYRRYYA